MAETPLPVVEMASIDILMDCLSCKGKGKVTRKERQIDPAFLDEHRKHAYTKVEGGTKLIGADCDCPRVTVVRNYRCAGCGGKEGMKVYTFKIPKPGQEVIITDERLLRKIFGAKIPERNGIVHSVEHDVYETYGFPANIAVGVSWDPLTPKGLIPKGQGADIWHFSLLEVKVV
jgi:hypothetical protein